MIIGLRAESWRGVGAVGAVEMEFDDYSCLRFLHDNFEWHYGKSGDTTSGHVLIVETIQQGEETILVVLGEAYVRDWLANWLLTSPEYSLRRRNGPLNECRPYR